MEQMTWTASQTDHLIAAGSILAVGCLIGWLIHEGIHNSYEMGITVKDMFSVTLKPSGAASAVRGN